MKSLITDNVRVCRGVLYPQAGTVCGYLSTITGTGSEKIDKKNI